MIEAHKLSVTLGGHLIVRDVDFVARRGHVTVILGANGSGKTTLLRALSGDLRASGAIRLNGRLLQTLKPWELAGVRAVLPQASALSFPFTVREIVRLGLMSGVRCRPARRDDELVDAALARVDLEGYAGRFYQDLSGGEQQRVQLARVLSQVWEPVLDDVPRYLLLDEPVSSLDVRHQLIIMQVARDFADAGGGVVAVLHDLNLAALFADRIAMMRAGSIHASGQPGAVLRDAVLQDVFDCPLRMNVVPAGGGRFVLPQSAAAARQLRAAS